MQALGFGRRVLHQQGLRHPHAQRAKQPGQAWIWSGTLSSTPSDAQLAKHLKQHPEAVEAAVQRLAHHGDSLGEANYAPDTAGEWCTGF